MYLQRDVYTKREIKTAQIHITTANRKIRTEQKFPGLQHAFLKAIWIVPLSLSYWASTLVANYG